VTEESLRTYMIELCEVSQLYKSKNGGVKALSDISFSVSDGQFVSIIGPSGCGKTTLLKIVGNLIEPTSGRIFVNGLSAREARLKGMFSFAFQNPVLLPWRRIIDNVRLPLEIIRQKGSRDPKELLRMLGLEGFESNYPSELSGGMQQRVALARALTFDPVVLLMDEPFGALDEFTRNELNLQLLKIWSEIKVTVLFITHSIAEAVFLSDKVIVLSERPATVKDTVTVPFERPRQSNVKETAEFQEMVKCLRLKLE
jgi:NitT/TauT family transport system ATP-binding protein